MNNYIYFTPFSSVFVVNFKQANVSWVWRWNCSSLKFTIFSKFLLFFPHLFTLIFIMRFIKKENTWLHKRYSIIVSNVCTEPYQSWVVGWWKCWGTRVRESFSAIPIFGICSTILKAETNSWKNIFLIKSLQNIIQHISYGQQILFWRCYISYGPQILL